MFTSSGDFVNRLNPLINKVCRIHSYTNFGLVNYKCVVHKVERNRNGNGVTVIDEYNIHHHYTWHGVVSIEELNESETILFKLEHDL